MTKVTQQEAFNPENRSNRAIPIYSDGDGNAIGSRILSKRRNEQNSRRSTIEQNSDWKVCGEAENGEVGYLLSGPAWIVAM